MKSSAPYVGFARAWMRVQYLLLLVLAQSSCIYVPADLQYRGPKQRPPSLEEYYAKPGSYSTFTDTVVEERSKYTLRKIEIQTPYGPSIVDYYARRDPSDSLVFVFPVLGGNNIFEKHFADYFAKDGIDAAIINRNKDFKKPENIDHIEEILRQGVIRDRLVMDFFSDHYGKKQFGSFGISRGAINAAIVAGIDPRLEYNVLALGGSHLAEVSVTQTKKGSGAIRRASWR